MNSLGRLVGLPLLIVAAACICAACSSSKYRRRTGAGVHVVEHSQINDSVGVDWTVFGQWLYVGSSSQQALIWPQGAFSYSVDSGFRGAADVLWIQAESSGLNRGEETEMGHLGAVGASENLRVRDSITYTDQRISESEMSLNLPNVWWVVVVAGILAAGWWGWRKDNL
jgi:hypothetical protein